MSLGTEIRPFLPSLRRYARELTNDRALGDMLVRRTLESMVADPSIFPRGDRPGVGFFKVFERIARDVERDGVEHWDGSRGNPFHRDGMFSLQSRKAALLMAQRGLSVDETAYVLDETAENVRSLVDNVGLSLGPMARRSVLIVEPEALIVSFLMAVCERMGHTVVGHASEINAALELAKNTDASLVITETRLKPGSGDSLIQAIRRTKPIEAVILSGDTDDHFLANDRAEVDAVVAKSASLAVLTIAVHLALGNSLLAAALPNKDDDDSEDKVDTALLDTAPVAFAPKAAVLNGSLTIVHQAPQSTMPASSLEGLKLDHAEEAKRLVLFGHNLGTSFTARLEKVAELLDQPLTDETTLRIANQAQALGSFRQSIEDELLPLAAADTIAFINALTQFSQQFPAWREFINATISTPPEAEEVAAAASALAKTLQFASDHVSEEVKDVVTEARSVDDQHMSGLREQYLNGVLHNAYAAVAGFVIARSKGVATEFNKELDKRMAGAALTWMSGLLVGVSGHLVAMATAYPTKWAWVAAALVIAQRHLRGK